jgi:RNA polymerase sigma-70 factor (sigma-E family)
MDRRRDTRDEQFAAYVRGRGEYLLRMAVLLTGDWHAAEDLVQASLTKLYCAWPRIRADGPDAYMRQVMVNTQRSWWRVSWRRERPAPYLAAVTPAGDRAEDFAERHVLRLLVRQALAALPARQRIVLVLRYCEDLPDTEVADLLGCSPATVRVHAHRGMRALREQLRDELPHWEVHQP